MFQADWQQAFNRLDPDGQDFLPRALALLARWDPACLNNPQRLKATLNRLIAQLDQRLSQQLSAVIQQPEFQELEAAWRNLASLVNLPVNYQRIHIKLLDMRWQELARDLNSTYSLRSSVLYNLIGNRELNTLGGLPFGLVVVNHRVSMTMAFDDDYDDLYTLELLGQLGNLCLCPFILTVAYDFFSGSGAHWLSDIRRIEKILAGPDYAGWRHLRAQPGARFLGLALPQIQLRPTYHCRRVGFIFNESSSPRPGLWGSAAFAFATVAIREFNRLNWFGFMKSRWPDRYQGALINLPPHVGAASHLKAPEPEVRLFGNLARFYAQQGFVPLCHSPLTGKYYFDGNNPVASPEQSDAGLVIEQLQTTLMVCRIAHYLKVQIRNLIGSFATAVECEDFLNRWLDNYCSNVVEGDEQTLAQYPLSKGQVRIRELVAGEGQFVCEVLLQPHYQFDHYCGEVLLSTDVGELGKTGQGG